MFGQVFPKQLASLPALHTSKEVSQKVWAWYITINSIALLNVLICMRLLRAQRKAGPAQTVNFFGCTVNYEKWMKWLAVPYVF